MVKKFKVRKRTVLISSLAVLLAATAAIVVSILNYTRFAAAEQSGFSPDSGETSRIITVYNSLSSLTHGSDADGGWGGSWGVQGAYWNRTRSAGEWVPTDAAAVTDVKNGITFHSTSRTQLTGTYPNPTSCSTQQYHDSIGTPVDNCTNTLTWTTASPAVTGDDTGGAGGNINKDPRTGLIWSQYLGHTGATVNFVVSGGVTWSWDGTTDQDSIDVGNKTASQLCSERGNGWRLPAQKELKQAYIDGSNFNLTNPPANPFWSVTESSPTNAWYVNLSTGTTYNYNKATYSYYVRCVR